jgi:outer membrane biosynthesis protein TonB
MWRWQRKNVHKRHLLWAKLIMTSSVMHVIALFFLFFVYHDQLSDYALTISRNLLKQDVSILIMQAQMAPRNRSVSRIASVGTRKKVTQSQAKNPEPKKVEQKKQVQKLPVKTAIVSEKKEQISKREQKQVKPAIKKEQPKPQVSQVAQQQKVEPLKQEVSTKESSAATQQQSDQQNNVVPDPDLPIAIDGQEYDAETLLRLAALQQEFARCWKPPVGIPEDCTCQVTVFVATDGKVNDMEMVTSSGILMYDVAARSALQQMELPRWTRGKTLTITFRQ